MIENSWGPTYVDGDRRSRLPPMPPLHVDEPSAAAVYDGAGDWEAPLPPEPPDDEFGNGEAKDAFDRAVDALTAELLDSAGLDTVPTLQPLVDGFLYRDTIARIIGLSGHMKSFVALDFAGHIGSGVDWRGHTVNQGLVLYLVAEGAGGIRKRVRAWEQHHGRRMQNVKFLPRPVQAGAGTEWAVLLEVCKKLQPVLIIFDTQARITVGAEENSAKEMGNVVHRLEALRSATSACVTLIHHQGLAGEHGRGSTAVKGALQTELRVNKKGKGEQTRVSVSSDKQKDDEELPDVVFAVQIVKLDGEAKKDGSPVTSVVLVPGEPLESADPVKRSPAQLKILAELEAAKQPMTIPQIGDAVATRHGTGLRRETISKALNELAAEGVVDRSEPLRGAAAYWQYPSTSGEV